MPVREASSLPSIDAKSARIYRNSGNAALIDLLDPTPRRVLDVGCGAGDNAELIRSRYPHCEVHGITYSAAEAVLAVGRMTSCRVWDIEDALPPDLSGATFDALIFSHVLEHLSTPQQVISTFTPLLRSGGAMLIAVPNVLVWSMRLQFLRGDFVYREAGVLDDTHLRFFTYETAAVYLLGKAPWLALRARQVTGSVPLWLARRHLLPRSWSQAVDRWGCRRWPNLFGDQILLKAVRD